PRGRSGRGGAVRLWALPPGGPAGGGGGFGGGRRLGRVGGAGGRAAWTDLGGGGPLGRHGDRGRGHTWVPVCRRAAPDRQRAVALARVRAGRRQDRSRRLADQAVRAGQPARPGPGAGRRLGRDRARVVRGDDRRESRPDPPIATGGARLG